MKDNASNFGNRFIYSKKRGIVSKRLITLFRPNPVNTSDRLGIRFITLRIRTITSRLQFWSKASLSSKSVRQKVRQRLVYFVLTRTKKKKKEIIHFLKSSLKGAGTHTFLSCQRKWEPREIIGILNVLYKTKIIIILEDHSLICFEASCSYLLLKTQVGVEGLNYKNLPFRKYGPKYVRKDADDLPAWFKLQWLSQIVRRGGC